MIDKSIKLVRKARWDEIRITRGLNLLIDLFEESIRCDRGRRKDEGKRGRYYYGVVLRELLE